MIRPETVIDVKDLNLAFGSNGFHLENIHNIQIQEGEIIGILGESGCGKSTFGKCLIGLINQRDKSKYNITTMDNSRIEVPFLGEIFQSGDLLKASKKELRKYRKHVQMIFQNPRSSLNLNMPVPDILAEAIKINEPNISNRELEKRIHTLTDQFEITGQKAKAKPKYLSGGERRRLGIAKVFATNPSLIIADEPVASLDVSIRGKILSIMKNEWQDRYNLWQDGKIPSPLTIIMISHDYDLIKHFCHKTIVFYGDIHVKRGTIVESYKNDCASVLHPYSEDLKAAADFMSAEGISHSSKEEKQGIRKELFTGGCVYINKCRSVQSECADEQPPLKRKNDNQVACLLINT